jgi:hypothetical protein
MTTRSGFGVEMQNGCDESVTGRTVVWARVDSMTVTKIGDDEAHFRPEITRK